MVEDKSTKQSIDLNEPIKDKNGKTWGQKRDEIIISFVEGEKVEDFYE